MSEKHPNILFLVIDGLRADRIFGENRTVKTPTIDRLRENGTYFSQAISTSDVTGTGMGCFFSGVYPFESGITETKVDSTLFTLINILKKNGYNMCGSGPNFKFFENIFNFVDNIFYYDYLQWREKDTILGKSGENVINHFKSIKGEPWFYYLHLMDIHGTGKLIKLAPEFQDKKFGETKYDKIISCIDYWLNNLLKHIDLDNTIIIITSDHGEYVSSERDSIYEIPNIYRVLRKLKKIIPILEPIGDKIFRILLKSNLILKKWYFSKQLDSEKMKEILVRSETDELFDDAIRIPLIISGQKMKSSKTYKNLVRQIDILPTILEMVGINYSEKIEGRSMVPIFNGNELDEIPVYIETGTALHGTYGNTIGIRTSKYKYLRNRFDEKKNIRLFNLIEDPRELENITKNEPNLVKKLEKTLKEILKNEVKFKKEEFTNEDKMVQEELKKLGYL